MLLAPQIQALHENTPAWMNWLLIGGSAVASWVQPIAGVVAILWGCLQIYSWIVNRGWRRKGR